jgi:hypothetical protein
MRMHELSKAEDFRLSRSKSIVLIAAMTPPLSRGFYAGVSGVSPLVGV